jgi:hypothetical protein
MSNNLAHGAKFFARNRATVAVFSRNFPPFHVTERVSPRLQEPASGPTLKPDDSSPYTRILSSKDHFLNLWESSKVIVFKNVYRNYFFRMSNKTMASRLITRRSMKMYVIITSTE